jgi:hypothetical protein
MLTFIQYRNMMNKFLNTEYEQNPSNCSGASKVHSHTYYIYEKVKVLTFYNMTN